VCKVHSASFKGECLHKMDCAAVCVGEGNIGGFCESTASRVCMCTKDGCGGGDGDGGGGSGDGAPAQFTASALTISFNCKAKVHCDI